MDNPNSLIRADTIIRSHTFSFRKHDWEPDALDMEQTIDILYHDHDLMIINKPHNFIIDNDIWSVQEVLQRLYPEYPLFHLCHQLDYATSGIMILGLNKRATGCVGNLFQNRLVRKEYIAIVRGWLVEDKVTVNLPIAEQEDNPLRMRISEIGDGRTAETWILVRRRGYMSVCGNNELPIKVTVVHLDLRTGRRHQLRVHLANMGHPIINDPLYEQTPPLSSHTMYSVYPMNNETKIESICRNQMYLHSRYCLLPLTRAFTTKKRKSKHGEPFEFDLAIQSHVSFLDLVSVHHPLGLDVHAGQDFPDVDIANICRWETEHVRP